jgi:type I restriction enzyme S subunit
MVPSELGEIPTGWSVLTLKKICETIYRYPQFYGMEKYDQGVPVIRGEHLLPNGKISNDFSDYWFVSEEFSRKFPRTVLSKFDIVLSVRGSVGNYSWVGDQHLGAQVSPNTIRLSVNPDVLCDCLLYPFLKAWNFKNRLLQTVSSSAVPAINASEFKTFEFIVPDISLQNRMSPLFRDMYQKIDASENQIKILTQTRDVLLPKLMSGKLRIKD